MNPAILTNGKSAVLILPFGLLYHLWTVRQFEFVEFEPQRSKMSLATRSESVHKINQTPILELGEAVVGKIP